MTTMEERLSRLEGGYEHVATKADIADLRAELKADISNVETHIADLRAEMASLRSLITALEGRVNSIEQRIDRVIFTMFGFGAAILAGLVGILVKLFI